MFLASVAITVNLNCTLMRLFRPFSPKQSSLSLQILKDKQDMAESAVNTV